MEVSKSLRIRPGMAVAFCGAGGKTTAIARAAAELLAECPILFATTTKIGLDQASLGSHRIITELKSESVIEEMVRTGGIWVITGDQVPGEAKWQGLVPEVLETIWNRFPPESAILLIEADGARQASLKIPAEHEPVIPTWVDVVVPISGLDVIGSQIQEPLVHRPDELAKYLGRSIETQIDWPDVARVLADPVAGLKGVPDRAEARVLLTKGTNPARVEDGEKICEQLMGEWRIQSVSIGDLIRDDPIQSNFSRTAGIVLAAGGATRFGDQKLLFPWRGKPLVYWAVQAARSGGLDPIVVVVGSEAEAIRSNIDDPTVTFIENDQWENGQSTSVRLGLQAVEPVADAAVFLLGDMPLVDGELIQALLDSHRSNLAPIVVPRVAERLGNPVLFDRVTFPALHELQGDRGGRAVFDRFPVETIEWGDSARVDIDTADDLQRLNS